MRTLYGIHTFIQWLKLCVQATFTGAFPTAKKVIRNYVGHIQKHLGKEFFAVWKHNFGKNKT